MRDVVSKRHGEGVSQPEDHQPSGARPLASWHPSYAFEPCPVVSTGLGPTSSHARISGVSVQMHRPLQA